MHGAILYSFGQYVRQHHGEDVWQDLLRDSRYRNEAFVPTGTYPDEEMVALIARLAQRSGRSAMAIQEELGEFLVPGLVTMYGAFISPQWRALDMIEHTEETIHKVVRMRDRAAQPPELVCRRVAPDRLTLIYGSQRRMCAVARGIIAGVGKHYGEALEIEETRCMLRGDARCEMSIRAVPVAASAAA